MQNFQQKQKSVSIIQASQEQYFKIIKEKLVALSEKAKKHNDVGKISKFQEILNEYITEEMNTLEKYIKETKINVVLMGTTSSGKSTFINALLGQQLLPSKTQICTSQVTYIGHQNIGANHDTKITINEEEFNSLELASQKLTKIQEEASPKFYEIFKKPIIGTVNIKTQSYFHKQLNTDLQDRVFFIDTPGIELSKTTPEQYLEHFGKINSLIKLDEYSIRINLWILNYTTFDSDKQLQQNMFKTKNEDDKIQKQQNTNQKQQKQLLKYILNIQQDEKIWQTIPFYYILNKYDQRQSSEDDEQKTIFQDIKDTFDSENIFMISALDALKYNVMNFGSKDANNIFIEKYFKDNQKKLKFKQQAQAEKYCLEYFKNNEELITDQDFNKFTSKISEEIEKQLNNLFQYKLNSLEQLIGLLDSGEKWINEALKQNQLLKDEINKIQSFFQINFNNYEKELQSKNDSFYKSIESLVDLALSQIDKNEKQPVIEGTCLDILCKIDEQTEHFLNITIEFKRKLLDQLQLNSQIDPAQFLIFYLGCQLIIKFFLEFTLHKYKEQFVKRQVKYVYETMSIRSYKTFWENVWDKVGFSSKGPSNVQRGSGALCAFIAHYSSEYESDQSIDKDQLRVKLREWKGLLRKETQKCMSQYSSSYHLAQFCITEIMNDIFS